MKLQPFLAAAGFAGFAAILVDVGERHAFDGAVAAALAANPSLRIESAASEPWRSEIRFGGVDWRGRGLSFHAGTVKVADAPGWTLIPAAFAAAGSASATDVTIVTGSSTYKIKQIDLAGASISSADLLKLFDSSEKQSAPDRFATLSATTITMPELTIESRIGETTQIFTYRDVVLSGVKDGKAAGVAASGASFSLSDPKTGEVKGAYGRIGLKDLDLVLSARMVSETQDQPTEKLPLYNSLAVDGAHIENAQFGLDLKTITLASVLARPPLKPASISGAAKLDPTTADALKWLDAMEINELAATDIKLELHNGQEPGHLRLTRALLARLDGRRIDALDFEGAVFERGPRRISLNSASLKGLNLEPLTVNENGQTLLEKNLRPRFDEIVLTALASDRPSAADEPAQKSGAFKVDRIGVKSFESNEAASIGLDVAVDHFVTALDEPGPLPDLVAMGYSQLDLTSRLNAVWTRASSELAISDFSLQGADMGALQLSALLGDVTPEIASHDQEVATAAARRVLVKKVDVTLVNEGVVDKALAAQAKSQHLSVDEVRQADMMKASLLLPALAGNAPALRLVGSELAKFIADPKSFNLIALSPQGVGVSDLEFVATPAELLKKLEITAYANR
ncbi:hypothetical protein Msil_0492 [Methylocella silvestris BL2]|uniref:Uncharacterized protein n=1 Tax=Methylocella silvestris (strain DSM 15510 / CIP 108128 / LMG 27833 / NCIMB 13906 / BL2) TaxID=395965 RepID=B8EJR0_METSB|nr:hypothetical protein [Methylocella silvestris]ACK49464.1 hypothetical protein Msil_0492 [Methylocella silvestris BL2]